MDINFDKINLSDEQIRNIRALAGIETQRGIANQFNTSQAVIQYILSGKTYSEVA